MLNNKKVCLVIIDGWGIGQDNFTNPIFLAKTPFLDHLKQNYPYYALQTSGIASGLGFMEEGSSEVGHLILGSGRTIYQTQTKIDMSIKDNSFLDNKALLQVINHVKQNNSNLHLVGMISSAETISSYAHLRALIYMAKINQVKNVFVHLIGDGKDANAYEAQNLITKLKNEKNKLGDFKVASICGRFYALNNHSEEYLKKYYEFLALDVNRKKTDNIELFFDQTYHKGISDEFIEPTAFENDFQKIQKNDALIMFNYKSNHFPMEYLAGNILNPLSGIANVKIASLAELSVSLNVEIAFKHEQINDCLASVLSQNQKRQVHLTEAHKSLHVTYYFNGLNKKPFPNEYWLVLPSKTIFNLSEDPYLEAKNITERALQIMEEGVYDFLLINYANADLAGHTGDMDLAKTVVNIIDNEIKMLVENGLKNDFVFLITSDHGNIESMKNASTGENEYGHDPNFVPIHIVSNQWKNVAPITNADIKKREKQALGVLSDVSPTVLDIFEIPKPLSMTGHSLLELLRIK